jgi:hypothetical protein
MATFDFLRPWGQGSILKKLGEIALLPVFDWYGAEATRHFPPNRFKRYLLITFDYLGFGYFDEGYLQMIATVLAQWSSWLTWSEDNWFQSHLGKGGLHNIGSWQHMKALKSEEFLIILNSLTAERVCKFKTT